MKPLSVDRIRKAFNLFPQSEVKKDGTFRGLTVAEQKKQDLVNTYKAASFIAGVQSGLAFTFVVGAVASAVAIPFTGGLSAVPLALGVIGAVASSTAAAVNYKIATKASDELDALNLHV